jgi:hypothetical protein
MDRTVNRVLQAWKNWDERQSEIDKAIGSGKENAIIIQRLKLEHFQKCRHLLAGAARKDEQAFMPLMASTISKLEKQVYPNMIQRLFFRVKSVLIDGPAHVRQYHHQRQENMETLKSQLASTGFSDFAGKLEAQLDGDHLKHVIPLSSQLDQKRSLNVALHFEKDAQDVIHFTTIDATLKHNDGTKADQTFQFKLEEWPGLKAQQVRNLLEGRAIRQHFTDIAGRPKSQWLELPAGEATIRKYTETYGFDLQKVIDKLPLSSITQAGGKKALIERLEQGQQVPVIWSHACATEQVYLHADPSNATVKLTDSLKKAVMPKQLNQRMANQQDKQQATIKQLSQNSDTMKISNNRKRGVRI